MFFIRSRGPPEEKFRKRFSVRICCTQKINKCQISMHL